MSAYIHAAAHQDVLVTVYNYFSKNNFPDFLTPFSIFQLEMSSAIPVSQVHECIAQE